MSGDFSVDKTAPAPQPKAWGPVAGTLWALLLFIGPQLMVAPLIPLLSGLSLSANTKVFAVYALVQLITLTTLFLVIRSYGFTLNSIGLGALKAKHTLWALGGLPIYFVISGVVTAIALQVLPEGLMQQQQELGFVANAGPLELALIFVALVVVTPLMEELLFRGFLLRGFWRFGPIIASVVVSLLFALAHWQINVGIDVFILSLVLCYVRIKSDSLWPAILIHALKNFIAFYLLFILRVDV